MLTSNKEEKNGLQPLFLSNVEKLTHGYLLFFTNIAVQFIQENIFFNMKKTINTGFITNVYLSVKKQQIYSKRDNNMT